MGKRSAGLLMYRRHNEILEIFLVHMGGPYWANKDLGAWSMPKGEYELDEEPLAAARREFHEETGMVAVGQFLPLQARKTPSGKMITAWAFEGDCDAKAIISNRFVIEWPPHSGNMQEFPEVDRAGWFTMETAKEQILKGQRAFIEELEQLLS